VLLQILEYQQVVLQLGHGPVPGAGLGGEGAAILGALLQQRAAGFRDLMAMMQVLHGLLQADGQAQADEDDDDVDEEIPPTRNGCVNRMYVEHGCGALLRVRGGLIGVRLTVWRGRGRCSRAVDRSRKRRLGRALGHGLRIF
jgi:hypothetical protein